MVWTLAQSPRSPILYCAPGNAGIESLATCVPIKADDIAGLKALVQSEKIDLTVVGPEAPLALGIVVLLATVVVTIFEQPFPGSVTISVYVPGIVAVGF